MATAQGHGQSILDRDHRVLTAGVILSITAVAFEGLAVTTIAPAIAGELSGLGLYGWIFSAYMLAQIVGTVIAGQTVDRRGPALPATIAVILFGAGLALAALAPTMPLLVASRALQGLGAGAIANCVYASINLRYDDHLRPSMLAVVSSAYIVPSMVGPYVAGVIAERFGWRTVFWILLPILIVSAALTLPTFRRGGATTTTSTRNQIPTALQLAIGTGLLLAGLGRLPDLLGVVVALIGLGGALPALRRLLPAGTLLARRGLPAAILTRGLFVAAYFSADTYLVLALTDLRGYSPSIAGLAIATGSLAWTACAWLQARLDRRDNGQGRATRIQLGVAMLLLGALGMALVPWWGTGALALALTTHLLAGMGIGLAHPTVGAFSFARVKEGESGAISAALLLADSFTPAVAIGLGGALIAAGQIVGWSPQFTIGGALGFSAPLLGLGLLAAGRLRAAKGE
ncbi:MAG TPA: MFS transporter [Thermomicrobiales bacterium]